jgi:hypothetical protein
MGGAARAQSRAGMVVVGWFSSVWPAERRAAVSSLRHHRPDPGEDVVLRGMRLWGDYAVGMVKDCNWLRLYEK